MAGIIEKGNIGLFENEIEFTGQHATMVRALREMGIFSTFREAYLTSAIVGFINSKKETAPDEKVQAASILPSDLTKRKKDLRLIYRLIMLLDEDENFTMDDYKNRTFRDDPEEHKEIIKQNMILFNSYASGGLEYLYDRFQDCGRLEKAVDELYSFVHEFTIEVGLLEEEGGLPEFLPEF